MKKRNWNENNLTKVKYKSQKRLNYCIATLNANSPELYILGYNHSKKEGFMPNTKYITNKIKNSSEDRETLINTFFKENYISDSENLIYKDGSVFDNLISLRQKLEYSYDTYEYSTNEVLCKLEQEISDNDKKTIIKWLKIYGMPFLGNPNVDTVGKAFIGTIPFCYGFTNDIATCLIKDACICRLGSFLIALNTFYKAFYYYLIYLYKTDTDSRIDLEILNKTPQKMSFEEMTKLETEIDSCDLSAIKSYIKSAFSSINIKNFFDINILFDNNKLPHPESYADTLISLAMYQLMIISSSEKIYSVNKCKTCNHLYIPTRRNNKYCVDCSRQKEWNKTNLKK